MKLQLNDWCYNQVIYHIHQNSRSICNHMPRSTFQEACWTLQAELTLAEFWRYDKQLSSDNLWHDFSVIFDTLTISPNTRAAVCRRFWWHFCFSRFLHKRECSQWRFLLPRHCPWGYLDVHSVKTECQISYFWTSVQRVTRDSNIYPYNWNNKNNKNKK